MKKIQKLLFASPIIATTCVPFIATSCGGNFIEPIETVDVLKEYKPSFKRLIEKEPQTTELDYSTAGKKYIEEMSNNPEHFQEDMIYATSRIVPDMKRALTNLTLKIAECGVSKPIFGSTTVWEPGFEDATVNTVSFNKRIHLVYNNEEDNGTFITRELTCDISYDNVPFMAYEHITKNTLVGLGWCTGFIDETTEDEAFWVHFYNTNPWHISYDCSDQLVKTIREEGQPDVEIKNVRYYSGYIDNAENMRRLWAFRLSDEHSNIDYQLQNSLIDCVLLLQNSSYYLEGILNKPDVCITKPLSTENITYGDEENLPINIYGIAAINSFDTKAKILGVQLLNEKPITAIETKTQRTITIPAHAQLKQKGETRYWYIENAILDHNVKPGKDVRRLYAFILDVDSLDVRISYVTGRGETGYTDTTLNLHYNSISLVYAHN